jgi:hypothetical protein
VRVAALRDEAARVGEKLKELSEERGHMVRSALPRPAPRPCPPLASREGICSAREEGAQSSLFVRRLPVKRLPICL